VKTTIESEFDSPEQRITLLGSPESVAFRDWLLENWKPALDVRVLDDKCMLVWLSEADEHRGYVEISQFWSTTGVPETFNVWDVAPSLSGPTP
jgi:hypothetical protein